jgi:hypothetical protein
VTEVSADGRDPDPDSVDVTIDFNDIYPGCRARGTIVFISPSPVSPGIHEFVINLDLKTFTNGTTP